MCCESVPGVERGKGYLGSIRTSLIGGFEGSLFGTWPLGALSTPRPASFPCPCLSRGDRSMKDHRPEKKGQDHEDDNLFGKIGRRGKKLELGDEPG